MNCKLNPLARLIALSTLGATLFIACGSGRTFPNLSPLKQVLLAHYYKVQSVGIHEGGKSLGITIDDWAAAQLPYSQLRVKAREIAMVAMRAYPERESLSSITVSFKMNWYKVVLLRFMATQDFRFFSEELPYGDAGP
jgi:hypothetical protein